MKKNIKKIVFTGPESSGKTTLSKWAAEQFSDVWVAEFSREFLEKRDGKYEEIDLEKIAAGQLYLEKTGRRNAKKFLFCDTDLTVIHIWQMHKFGRPNPKVFNLLTQNLGDFYFLMTPDLDWEFDSLREAFDQAERDVLFQKYLKLLGELGVPFAVVSGEKEARERAVLQPILYK